MNRTLKQAAAVLGLSERALRRSLRDRRILLADGTLAAPYVDQGHLYMDPRARWNPTLGTYSHYAVVMVTERGIGWLADKLGITVTVTRPKPEKAA